MTAPRSRAQRDLIRLARIPIPAYLRRVGGKIQRVKAHTREVDISGPANSIELLRQMVKERGEPFKVRVRTTDDPSGGNLGPPVTDAPRKEPVEMADPVMTEHYREWRKNLTSDQRAALALWQLDYGYRQINTHLRGEDYLGTTEEVLREELEENIASRKGESGLWALFVPGEEERFRAAGEDRIEKDLARLRGVDAERAAEARRLIPALDEAIATAPPFEEPVRVWREFRVDQFEDLDAGDVIEDPGFMATSTNEADARAWRMPGEKVVASIDLPPGFQAANPKFTEYDDPETGEEMPSDELVLPRGMKLRVRRMWRPKDYRGGSWKAEMEVAPVVAESKFILGELRASPAPQVPSPVPLLPGEAPIPAGHVRLFHVTSAKNRDGIAKHGISVQSSRGRSYGEPTQVWGSAGIRSSQAQRVLTGELMDTEMIVVEFHADPGTYTESKDLDVGKGSDPRELEARQSDVTLPGGVPPENIVAVHEPWHSAYRYLLEYEDAVKAGEYDYVIETSPDYARAIKEIKARPPKDVLGNRRASPDVSPAPVAEDEIKAWERDAPEGYMAPGGSFLWDTWQTTTGAVNVNNHLRYGAPLDPLVDKYGEDQGYLPIGRETLDYLDSLFTERVQTVEEMLGGLGDVPVDMDPGDIVRRREYLVLPRDVTLYRGQGPVDLPADFVDKGFVATTTGPGVARAFGEVMEVRVPAGTKVVWIDGTEREMLLNRGTHFRKVGPGVVEVVPPDPLQKLGKSPAVVESPDVSALPRRLTAEEMEAAEWPEGFNDLARHLTTAPGRFNAGKWDDTLSERENMEGVALDLFASKDGPITFRELNRFLRTGEGSKEVRETAANLVRYLRSGTFKQDTVVFRSSFLPQLEGLGSEDFPGVVIRDKGILATTFSELVAEMALDKEWTGDRSKGVPVLMELLVPKGTEGAFNPTAGVLEVDIPPGYEIVVESGRLMRMGDGVRAELKGRVVRSVG